MCGLVLFLVNGCCCRCWLSSLVCGWLMVWCVMWFRVFCVIVSNSVSSVSVCWLLVSVWRNCCVVMVGCWWVVVCCFSVWLIYVVWCCMIIWCGVVFLFVSLSSWLVCVLVCLLMRLFGFGWMLCCLVLRSLFMSDCGWILMV